MTGKLNRELNKSISLLAKWAMEFAEWAFSNWQSVRTVAKDVAMISAGRVWWILRRDLRRGLQASWHAYQTLPKILDWRCPDFGESAEEVLLHSLVGEEQALLCGWMLASWHLVTQRNWQIVLHDDGTMQPETAEALGSVFPGRLSVVWRPDSDEAMRPLLAQHLHCQQYRDRHPLALKIFDIPLLTPARRFLLIDSDILFFQKPDAILRWVDSGSDECWFNEDVQETSLLDEKEVKELFHCSLWPKVNSGLCLLTSAAINLDFCDLALRRSQLGQRHFWRIEQTLFALCASKFATGGLLPSSYEVSLARHSAPDCVARHYVGAVRDRFYGEGLPRVMAMMQRKTGSSAKEHLAS